MRQLCSILLIFLLMLSSSVCKASDLDIVIFELKAFTYPYDGVGNPVEPEYAKLERVVDYAISEYPSDPGIQIELAKVFAAINSLIKKEISLRKRGGNTFDLIVVSVAVREKYSAITEKLKNYFVSQGELPQEVEVMFRKLSKTGYFPTSAMLDYIERIPDKNKKITGELAMALLENLDYQWTADGVQRQTPENMDRILEVLTDRANWTNYFSILFVATLSNPHVQDSVLRSDKRLLNRCFPLIREMSSATKVDELMELALESFATLEAHQLRGSKSFLVRWLILRREQLEKTLTDDEKQFVVSNLKSPTGQGGQHIRLWYSLLLIRISGTLHIGPVDMNAIAIEVASKDEFELEKHPVFDFYYARAELGDLILGIYESEYDPNPYHTFRIISAQSETSLLSDWQRAQVFQRSDSRLSPRNFRKWLDYSMNLSCQLSLLNNASFLADTIAK